MESVADNLEKETISPIIQSKEIICPQCGENCLLNINGFKIDLYGCKNGHEKKYLSLDEFNSTQNIDESKIICNECNNQHKSNHKNEFFKCLKCKKNLCPSCKQSHDNNHSVIDYDKKNYICEFHGEIYTSYCNNCKNNLCKKCESQHSNHKKIYFSEVLPKKDEIQNELEDFKRNINRITSIIKDEINKLNNIIKNVEKIYEINSNIINEKLNSKKINFQIIKNLSLIHTSISEFNINYVENFYSYDYFNETNLENIFGKLNQIKELKENEIEINLSGENLEEESLVCSRYIKISDLKNLIKSKNSNLKNDFILIFYGKEMDNNMRLNDYDIDLFGKYDEYITVINKSNINNKFIYNSMTKINLRFNNTNEIFYIKSISKLFKYTAIYYNIKEENILLYLNGIKRLTSYDDPPTDIYN